MIKYIECKKMFFRKLKEENNKYYISKLDKKVANKIAKKLRKSNMNKVVCDKEIMNNKQFMNYLYAKNLSIYNGRILYKYIIINIFEYLENLGLEIKKMNISILVNENSKINEHIIHTVSNIFKRVSIITNNAKRFARIESKLEENGIPVNISNNKKKSLSKADFILNIDFPNELINKFNINKNSIILNIEEEIKITSKKYNGININYYEIDFENKFEEYENFDKNIIYESMYLNIEKR